MAKPLGAKTLLIRDAIKAHPDMGPKEIADLINTSDARKQDNIEVKPIDVSQQKLAMKKAAQAEPAAKPRRTPRASSEKRAATEGERQLTTPREGTRAPAPAANASPVDLIDSVFSLAQQCGGMEQFKRLVDRLAGVQAQGK